MVVFHVPAFRLRIHTTGGFASANRAVRSAGAGKKLFPQASGDAGRRPTVLELQKSVVRTTAHFQSAGQEMQARKMMRLEEPAGSRPDGTCHADEKYSAPLKASDR